VTWRHHHHPWRHPTRWHARRQRDPTRRGNGGKPPGKPKRTSAWETRWSTRKPWRGLVRHRKGKVDELTQSPTSHKGRAQKCVQKWVEPLYLLRIALCFRVILSMDGSLRTLQSRKNLPVETRAGRGGRGGREGGVGGGERGDETLHSSTHTNSHRNASYDSAVDDPLSPPQGHAAWHGHACAPQDGARQCHTGCWRGGT
jgi:hypothetical protein